MMIKKTTQVEFEKAFLGILTKLDAPANQADPEQIKQALHKAYQNLSETLDMLAKNDKQNIQVKGYKR